MSPLWLGGAPSATPNRAGARVALTPFERAVAFVLEREGAYSNDPYDAGLETAWGISRRAYPTLEPWPPTREQAITIYYRDYWLELRCDELPPAVALMVFDSGVNQGQNRAALMLQRAARVKDDGVIGPITLAAVAASPDGTLERLAAERCWAYTATRNYPRYGRGWFARVAGALLAGLRAA